MTAKYLSQIINEFELSNVHLHINLFVINAVERCVKSFGNITILISILMILCYVHCTIKERKNF